MMEIQHSERGQDVQEIIGTPANWLARYGTALLLLLVVSLVTVASFYTYPTVVEGDLTLTTIDPPRPLRARQDFPVQDILVENRDTVDAGQAIVIAANGRARFEHVLALEDLLISTRGKDDAGLIELEIPATLILGQLQDAVYEFQDKQEVYRNLALSRLDGYTTRELEAQIRDRERYIRRQRSLQADLEDKLIGLRARLSREEQLANDGIDNRDQLGAARRMVQSKEEDLQRSMSNLRSASFEIEIRRNQIESYRSGRSGSAGQAAVAMREAFEDLQSAVANWKRDFTLVSPVTGTVVFAPSLREAAYIFEQSLIATVIPLNTGGIIGQVTLPVRGSVKVDIGQRVLVRFPKYPYLEYGSVEGRIVDKGIIPIEEKITVEVEFPDGLVTTTGFPIEPEPFMQGEASIITEQKRLMARFLDSF